MVGAHVPHTVQDCGFAPDSLLTIRGFSDSTFTASSDTEDSWGSVAAEDSWGSAAALTDPPMFLVLINYSIRKLFPLSSILSALYVLSLLCGNKVSSYS